MALNGFSKLEKIVVDHLKKYNFDDPEAEKRLTRIGLLLKSQTELNIRRRKLILDGNLFNSIDYKITRSGDTAKIEYGSFGVSYAAIHEFGFQGPVTIRQHERLSRLGNSHTVKQHSRDVNITARPYIRPALVAHRDKILSILAGF